MTLNGQNALYRRNDASFGAHCTNLNEDRPILSATKMYANDCSFWKYKVHADTHRSSSWPGRQTTLGVVDDGSFWRFRWLRLCENFRDMPNNIIWRYATPCRPVTQCKMHDLEWLFHVKIRFHPALLESERLNVKKYTGTCSAILRCSVHCTIS